MKAASSTAAQAAAGEPRRIHFRKRVRSVLGYGIILTSACNRDIRPFTLYTTSDRDRVTCEQCRQSHAFKTARIPS